MFDIAADTRILVEEGTTILVGPDISVSVKSGAVLHLSGTEEKPVIMTADSSDARPGHWKGIVFQDGGLIAQHAAILYGGQNSGVSRAKGTLAFWDSGATRPCSYVGNSTIAYSETYGLQISGPYSGAVHLDSSTTDFSGNILDDVLGTATGPAVATIEEALACRQ